MLNVSSLSFFFKNAGGKNMIKREDFIFCLNYQTKKGNDLNAIKRCYVQNASN